MPYSEVSKESQSYDTSRSAEPTCNRCKENAASHTIRSEQVCKDCFSFYIITKTVKRMDIYRIRKSTSQPRRLLLPLSFGPSSSCLLHILDQQLMIQHQRMGRVAYNLLVVHVDLFLEANDQRRSAILLQRYKQRFPKHDYLKIGLEDAMELNDIDWSGTSIPEAEKREGEAHTPRVKRLRDILASVASASSRADLVSTLLTRLLVDVGKNNGCESILFGDSTTRIAERTLAETAKGRGFSVPWQVSDGPSPHGIGFHFPLRDLLKKELISFVPLTTPPLTDIIILPASTSQTSASSKDTTIDDLMAQYFESVEENYPSIVSNVVRTSSKLQASSTDSTHCRFCNLPVTKGTNGTSGWGGDQNPDFVLEQRSGAGGVLCYGCSRSING